MKKIFKKIGLSFAVLACMVCAGVGVSLGFSKETQSVKASEVKTIESGDYYISGAGIRLVNDADGAGIRFHTLLSNSEYENLTDGYKSGTLIIPEIRYDGDLTLEDMEKEEKYRPVNVDTTGFWYAAVDAEGNNVMKTTAYLYNIPEKAYGARYVSRSYIQYADGTVAYSYTDAERWKSMSDVASIVTNDDGQSTQIKTQVAPYIVGDVTVTYDLPDGKVSQDVTYGTVAKPDEVELPYEDSLYQINGWTDQYGRSWDIENDTVTMPITLTPTFGIKSDAVVASALGGEQSGTNNPTTKYEGADDMTAAPTGFSNVTRYDSNENWTKGVMNPAGYNNTSLTSYSEVWFAIKTNGVWNISDTTYASSDWVYFHLTQTGTSVWTVEITINDEVITLENQSGTDRSYGSDWWERANAISTILYGQGYVSGCTDGGSVLINNGGSGETITLYATEIQINRPNITGMPAADAEAVKDDNGDQVWSLRDGDTSDSTHEYTGEYTMTAPTGFTQVKRYDSNTETGGDGKEFTANRAWASSYDDTDLSAYSEVWFAMNISGGYFSDRTNTLAFGGTWAYFHLTQTSDSVWDVEVVADGVVKATYTARNGATNSTAQPANSIARIVYYTGSAVDGVYIFMSASVTSCSIYTTEVKGVLKDGATTPDTETEETILPGLEETTAVTDTSGNAILALGGEHSTDPLTQYTGTDDTTAAPAGFESVARFDTATAGAMWAAGYNNTDISAYDEVWFAYKITNGYLKTPAGDKTTSSWIYFHLTQVADSLWTIEITIDGEVYATFENQSGTEVNSTSVWVQRPNAISTILYGNAYASPDGAYVLLYNNSGATMSVYATEIRASIGKRAVWSAIDGATFTEDTNATFKGFSSIYKKEDFTAADFAKLDLTGKGYTQVKFAFWIHNDSTMTINGAATTIKNGRSWYVTMTAIDGGWNVTMVCDSDTWNYTHTFTTTAKSINELLGGMTIDDTKLAYMPAYCTEVRAIHLCEGEATCTKAATCIYCGNEYGAAKGHGASVWVDNVYQCEDCGEVYGSVNTELDDQDVVLYENATAATFNAQSANAAIDLSGVTDLTISTTETQVTLGGDVYAGTIADNQLTIAVKPQDVFGEYTATFTLTVEGKEFTITAPVLVVTNKITTAAGLKAMKEVLRGADLATATSAGIGGIGGENTMNGDGYYTLGADVVVNSAWGFYRGFAFGTPTVSFTGTFDGKGYALTGFSNSQAALYGDVNQYQVNSGAGEAMNMFYESSLFGVMDGTIKNVALTGMTFGAYGNLIYSGTGTLQDVYLQIIDLQHRSDGSHIPLFVYGQTDAGTLRNVVFDFTAYSTSYPTANFDAATAKGIKAENVAVYGFLSDYKDKVYYNLSTDTTTNGAEVGMYVTYADGTDNGGAFTVSALNDGLWTVANGVPTFKNLAAADAETVAPSTQEGANEAGVGYYIAWDSDGEGAYDAAELIKSVTYASTGKTLTEGAVKPNATDRNQIIVGTYNEYMGYLSAVPTLNTNGCANFGVYHVETENGNTIYVLADSEDGFAFAAKELCRKLYGYQVYSADSVQIDAKSGVEIPADFDYTSYVAFEKRIEVNTMTEEEKLAVGLTHGAEYTPFIEMHNALNYLDALESDKYGFTLDAYTDANVLATDGPDDSNTTAGEQLCYLARGDKTSFDNLVDRVVNVIVQRAKVDRRITSVNLMMEDSVDYCACSACAAFSTPSIAELVFLNEVAKKLQTNTEIISRTIGVQFMSYGGYGKAPVLTASDITALNNLKTSLGITYDTATFTYDTEVGYTPSSTAQITVLKAEENVRLLWTTQGANHSFGLTHMANDHMYEALQGWIASLGAESVDAYMYQTVYKDYFLPLNTWKYQVEWYKTLSNMGLKTSISNLGDQHNAVGAQTAFGAFKTYINSRVMADVNVDYDTLKKEFFAEDGYYGAGGPTMRTFFEELEAVMDTKKQTGSNPSDYLDYTTFRWASDDHTGTAYTDRRQAFLNGEYHYDIACVLFSHWTTSSGTLYQELYSGNGNTQQANLEKWYTYCNTALGKVASDSVYAQRIKIEQYFPEYAFLLLQTTYTVSMSSSSVKTKPSSSVITTTYQAFYDKVKTVMEVPSEFYAYDSTKTVDVYEGSFMWYEAYMSFFKTWGVTF